MLSDEQVNSSNMLNITSHKRKKDIKTALDKINPDAILQVADGGESFLTEIDDAKVGTENILGELKKEFDLLETIMHKFNMGGSEASRQSCFS